VVFLTLSWQVHLEFFRCQSGSFLEWLDVFFIFYCLLFSYLDGGSLLLMSYSSTLKGFVKSFFFLNRITNVGVQSVVHSVIFEQGIIIRSSFCPNWIFTFYSLTQNGFFVTTSTKLEFIKSGWNHWLFCGNSPFPHKKKEKKIQIKKRKKKKKRITNICICLANLYILIGYQ
jgi:hypothetical protein